MAFNPVGVVNWLEKADAAKAKEDELERNREDTLLGIYLKKLDAQQTAKGTDKYLTAAEAAMKLQDRVDNADLNEEDRAFFNTIAEDPFAAQKVLDLVEKNVTETGATIALSDVRSLINIVGSKMSTKDKVDYISLITGSDVSDDKKYYELVKQIGSIVTTPGGSLVVDIKPEANIVPKIQQELFERQFEIVNGQLLRNAKQFVKTENYDQGNPQVRKIQGAIDMIESGNKDSISVGREILMDEYLTPENFKQDYLDIHPEVFRGWEKNYFLPRSLQAVPDVNTGRVLTAEDIAASPTLQNLGAEPGDKIINIDGVDVLHDSNGNPKQ